MEKIARVLSQSALESRDWTNNNGENVVIKSVQVTITDGIDTLTMLNRYDEKGRLIHECDYQGMVRQFQYDTWSQCVSENSAFGERSFEYDGFGNLKKETDIYGKN